jgi:hypothetical protein
MTDIELSLLLEHRTPAALCSFFISTETFLYSGLNGSHGFLTGVKEERG